MGKYFKDFDFSGFWDDSDYSIKEYIEELPSDELIASIEAELGGYKLPESYLELMKMHNGGIPVNTRFPTKKATSWSEDHIAITGIMGIGREKTYSLCGELGSSFMIEEWGYPQIGICIADTPSAGHDMIMLDYSKCGKSGEPRVVHVDQEDDYKITPLAKNFEEFILGLVNESEYDTSEEDYAEDKETILNGKFSTLLASLCKQYPESEKLEKAIRQIAMKVLESKGFFALHADDLSVLLYDIQFLLYTNVHKTDNEGYLKEYPNMIAMSGEFSTGGYAPKFIQEWLTGRMASEEIIESENGLQLTAAAKQRIIDAIKQHSA